MSRTLQVLIVISFMHYFVSCSLSKDPQIREIQLLQRGRITEDTSYVYWLPYKNGTKHRLVQGYFSMFSHKHRAALDFKMKRGTEIYAAREGIVSRLVENNDEKKGKRSDRTFANLLILNHNDGSRAGYWHLQKNGVLVNMGDSIKKGQLIALSGNTGYSAFPHLHFIAWKSGNAGWTPTATRFLTTKGKRYLKPLKRYRSVHKP